MLRLLHWMLKRKATTKQVCIAVGCVPPVLMAAIKCQSWRETPQEGDPQKEHEPDSKTGSDIIEPLVNRITHRCKNITFRHFVRGRLKNEKKPKLFPMHTCLFHKKVMYVNTLFWGFLKNINFPEDAS